MEFPVLFDEPESDDQPGAPEVSAQPEPSIPGTGLVVLSAPPAPVIEVISDADALRKALDKPHPIAMLGNELISQGFITREQLDKAVLIQSGDRKRRIGEILVETGAVSREIVDFALARRLGMPAVDLHKLDIDRDAVRLIPKILARKHMLMPCMIHRKRLVAAIENPTNHASLKPIEFACGMHVLGVLAPKKDIEWAIDHCYRNERKDKSPMDYWV